MYRTGVWNIQLHHDRDAENIKAFANQVLEEVASH